MPALRRFAAATHPATIGRTARIVAVLAGTLCAVAAASGGSPAVAGGRAPALTAQAISLNESAELHLTSRHGFTLNEHGSASGSVSGPMYVHLTIVSTARVVAEVNFYPRGGSISGQASASYRRGSSTASFTGTLAITRGTGSYAHAHGSGLSFSGTIRRSDEAIAVQVHGTASE